MIILVSHVVIYRFEFKRCKNFSKEPKLVSFLSSLMTLATMDEQEASKVTVTDSIPASSKRGINDSNTIVIYFIMTAVE